MDQLKLKSTGDQVKIIKENVEDKIKDEKTNLNLKQIQTKEESQWTESSRKS